MDDSNDGILNTISDLATQGVGLFVATQGGSYNPTTGAIKGVQASQTQSYMWIGIIAVVVIALVFLMSRK